MHSIVFYRVILVWLALAGSLGLGGCTVYDAVFHPHRLGTPAMTPEAKAKLRAAEKARHKGLSLQPATDADETAGTGGAAPTPSANPTNVSNSKAYSELPAGTRATYDKQGLLKKSMLVRLQDNRNKLHHYDLSAPKHTEATRDARKMRKHSKTSGKRGAEPRAPADPEPAADPAPAADPTQPAAATAVAAPAQPSKAARPAARTLPPRPAKVAPKPRTPRPAAPAPAAADAQPTAAPADPPAPAPTTKPSKKDKKAPKAPKPDPTQPPGGGQ